MALPGRYGAAGLAAAALLLSALLTLVVLNLSNPGAEAHIPPGPGTPTLAGPPEHPGLDFSIGADVNGDTTDECSSAGAPAFKCSASVGETFTVTFYLNNLDTIAAYKGYDANVTYDTDLTIKKSAQSPEHVWPDCDFPAHSFANPGEAAFGCAAFQPPTSTYTGAMVRVRFNCPATEGGPHDITLNHGFGKTSLVDGADQPHSEPNGSSETLSVNCAAPTPTPTFTSTPTHTPTSTPTETATSTNTPTATSTPVATETPAATDTPTVTETPTSTISPTPSISPTASNTPTRTNTPTITPTRTFTPVPAAPDLTVDKDSSPQPVASGAPLKYTIEVRNEGDLGAEFVRLLDDLPANYTVTGFSTTRGDCALDGPVTGGTLDCDLGSFGTGPAAIAVITVQGHLTKTGVVDVENTATVDPAGIVPESDETNNSDTEVTQVNGPSATPTPLVGEHVKEAVVPGAKVTTDTEGDGATPNDVVETSVMVTREGKVSIDEVAISQPNPLLFLLFGQQVEITAPPATILQPMVITFLLEDSIVPPAYSDETVQLFRNGVIVPDCSGGSGVAAPNPCVTKRHTLVGSQAGDVQLTVLSNAASRWNFGLLVSLPTPEFTQGDVDGDGDIDSIDAELVLMLEARLIDALPVPLAGDTTKDGLVDAADAALILQFHARLIGGF